jgi:hypothetical protein
MPRSAIGAFYAMISYWKRASRNSASPRPAEIHDARHFPRMRTRWSLGPKVARRRRGSGNRIGPLYWVDRTSAARPSTGAYDPKQILSGDLTEHMNMGALPALRREKRSPG